MSHGHHGRVIGALLALLLLGILGSGVVLASPWIFPSGFKTASYVPRVTWLYATMTMRPGILQLKNTRSFIDAFTSQPGFEAAVRAHTQSGPSSSSRLDVQREVIPLLDGEIA